MSVIPANEALAMQEAKKKKYDEGILAKTLFWLETEFNYRIQNCDKDDEYVCLPENYCVYTEKGDLSILYREDFRCRLNEYMALVDKVKNAGYYVIKDGSHWYPLDNKKLGGSFNGFPSYRAYFKYPEPKGPWWKIW